MFCPRCHRVPASASRWSCPHDGAPLCSGRRVDFIRAAEVDETGEVIGGRYTIRGLLGHGGMAFVYLAEDGSTGEPVAIKVLNRDRVLDHDARARFFREVEVARQLSHPSVLRILDAGEIPDGSPYLVTEF